MQDFDDLMRSGTTMKVSLTPARLKTFEVRNSIMLRNAVCAYVTIRSSRRKGTNAPVVLLYPHPHPPLARTPILLHPLSQTVTESANLLRVATKLSQSPRLLKETLFVYARQVSQTPNRQK